MKSKDWRVINQTRQIMKQTLRLRIKNKLKKNWRIEIHQVVTHRYWWKRERKNKR